MSDLKVPKFATEAEEAKWWYENDEKVSDEFEKAAKEGRLKRGGVMRLLAERGLTPASSPVPNCEGPGAPSIE
jgi:hypothetical protein